MTGGSQSHGSGSEWCCWSWPCVPCTRSRESTTSRGRRSWRTRADGLSQRRSVSTNVSSRETTFASSAGADRCRLVTADVLPTLLDLSCDVAAQQAVHGRLVPQHRSSQSHQLQHALRPQDAHDDLPWHRPNGFHGQPLDHRQLDHEVV